MDGGIPLPGHCILIVGLTGRIHCSPTAASWLQVLIDKKFPIKKV